MFEKLIEARRSTRERADLARVLDACRQLLTEKGEANSVAIATDTLQRFERLNAEGVQRFFEVLATEFDPDPGDVLRLAERYAVNRSPEHLVKLARAAEPPRQELLRRLNRAPGGTAVLVRMRAKLLDRLRQDRSLMAVDADFEHLMTSWFNPGFLKMTQVSWNSPASLLERIIHHEAVHAIDGWSDLRRRLEPDRRLFAFFHPMLPDEPLIFVEVALLSEIPGAIGPLLDRSAAPVDEPKKFKVATFYSISNCQPGLRGVNLGNFLIKRVAEQLQRELPSLKTFCTLSPVPSLVGWISKVDEIASARLKPAQVASLNQSLGLLRKHYGANLAQLQSADPAVLAALPKPHVQALMGLAAFYLVLRTTSSVNDLSVVGDPVARFHLNNGARLERINLAADLTRKGVKQSLCLMVNYLYDLQDIEDHHQRFVDGEVVASKAVMSLMA